MKIDLVLINGTSIKSGKDTVGNLIAKHFYKQNQLGPKVGQVICLMTRFTYRLKQMAELMTGMKMKEYNESWFELPYYDFTQEQKDFYLSEWDMTLGRLLQLFATETCRDTFDKDIWAKTCARHIFEDLTKIISVDHPTISNVLIIIPDWRFPNEPKVQNYLEPYLNGNIKRHYPLIDIETHYIKVFREVEEKDLTGRDMNHTSENSLKDFRADIIENTGSLSELEDKCNEYTDLKLLS